MGQKFFKQSLTFSLFSEKNKLLNFELMKEYIFKMNYVKLKMSTYLQRATNLKN